jgi:hypothetical protein
VWDDWNPTSLLYKLFQEDHEDDKKMLGNGLNSFTQAFSARGYKKASRRRSFAVGAMCTKHHVNFREDQIKSSAFQLPERKVARDNLDRGVRAPAVKIADQEE